jgi:hypothetical protein
VDLGARFYLYSARVRVLNFETSGWSSRKRPLDGRWVTTAVHPLMLQAWTNSARQGIIFPKLGEFYSGRSQSLDYLVNLLYTSPLPSLRLMFLQNKPFPDNLDFGYLFPSLESYLYTLIATTFPNTIHGARSKEKRLWHQSNGCHAFMFLGCQFHFD